MLTGRDFQVQMQRYEDLLHEADHARLLKEAPKSLRFHRQIHARILGWTGHWLTIWGQNLLKRYGRPVTIERSKSQVPTA